MSKISTYSLADEPLQLSDRLIGTEAPRPIPSSTPLATKNFSLGELLQLFSSEFPAATLQAVLNAGNIATQDINLTGTINCDVIKPTNIEDMLGSQGTPFQVLSKAVGGFNWVDIPGLSTPNLQQVTDQGNVTTNGIEASYLLSTSGLFIFQQGIYNSALDGSAIDGDYVWSLPNQSGTIALITDIPPPVGTPSLADVVAVGNTTNESISALSFSAVSGADISTLNSSQLFINSSAGDASVAGNGLSFSSSGELAGWNIPGKILNLSNLTLDYNTIGLTSRTQQFQDADGVIALVSDIPASSGIPHATAAGTDTYTATITGVTAYADGDAYLIRFTNGNTTGATLNINTLGAIPLYRNNDGPLLGGDIVSGAEMLCVYNSTSVHFQVIGVAPNTLIAYVTNDDSVTITKGQAVYAFSGTGDRMTVKRASNTGDATSAQTVGLVLSISIAANQKGLIMMQGLLDGLNILPTATWSDGDPVYLGATPGSITKVKPYAPNHLVYLGVVTTASNGSAGRMYVKVQNGYELDELHNVQAQSPSVNDVLYYFGGSPGQWKTAPISTVLGYTPGTVTSVAALTLGTTGTDLSSTVATGTTTPVITLNVPTASATNRGALSSTDWSTFNNKQNNLKTFNTTQGVYYFNEFMGSLAANVTAATNDVINTFGNGQGTTRGTGTITNRTNQQGVVESLTSANNTGQAGWIYGGASLFIGTGAITLETYVNITTLSTLSERFYTFFGYATGSNYSNILNNIAIVYDEGGVYLSANASPNFKCITRAGSTATTTVTSIAVTAGQWYKLKININAAASSVEFYIDNVLRATHTTNIPLTTTPMFIANAIIKNTGSTARAMQTDYFMYEEIFTNPR